MYHHDEEISLETGRHRNDNNNKIHLKGRSVNLGLDSTDSGYSTAAGFSESGNEPLFCMRSGEFRDQLSDYELHKDSAP